MTSLHEISSRYLHIPVGHRRFERSISKCGANLCESDHEVLLSSVSVWEISVKHALGKLPLPASLDHFVVTHRERHGIIALPLDESAVVHLYKLPPLHRDPFERMLICQAIEHNCVILTPDPLIVQYPVRTQW
jgi:PIN domain nuclease of toxin-antitoxin system